MSDWTYWQSAILLAIHQIRMAAITITGFIFLMSSCFLNLWYIDWASIYFPGFSQGALSRYRATRLNCRLNFKINYGLMCCINDCMCLHAKISD